jgi:2-haloacid dehalogenase
MGAPLTVPRPASPVVKAVVWDLGGVLIDWDPRYLYRSLFDDDAAMEDFLATVCTPEWNRGQDAGRPWADAVDELATRHPEQRDLITAYWERWHETLGDAIAPTVAVLDALRSDDVRLIALTNWSGETFPVARPRYPFLDWFEGIVVSGDERLIKPDPRIFDVLIRRYGLDPATTLFIDDSQENVEAAAALGFIAIRYLDAEALRRDLRRFGLLSRAPG